MRITRFLRNRAAHWRLLTSHAVTSAADAARMIELYRRNHRQSIRVGLWEATA